MDRSSGYYDQFGNKRGASMLPREDWYNPATVCRCVAARSGDRRKITKMKDSELWYDRVRPKREAGPVIPDLPRAPVWRMEEDLFPEIGAVDPHPSVGKGDPVKALREGRSTGGKLEVGDWKSVTKQFNHNWPRNLLPKTPPLERHFRIPATPPNFLKGPAVMGYAECYKKVTEEFTFVHSLPKYPHV